MTRILVVEDSRTQLEEIRQILEAAGFTVAGAADGSLGLERLLKGPFDLVLSDVLMPGLSGYELCRAAKTHSQTKHVPVVLLTQLNDPLDILRGLECGADNFITKPFEATFLVKRVRSILANRSRRPGQPPEPGVALSFRGRGVTITTDKEQILDLLFATLEEFIRTKALEAQMKTANQALTKQTHELEEAGRRKDRHLAMLAHELRTPLDPLLNGLHVLRDAPDESPVRGRALDAMERQVRHLSRLVEDLVDVSRITHGKVQLRRERLDLARLVRNTAEDRRGLLEQRGLQLTVEAPEIPVWMEGDAVRLSQVVNNLLDNAAKFTEPGGQVAVRLEVEEDRRYGRMVVTDTGRGIEPDMLDRLWDVFVQADRSLDRSAGGLGLGLSVVRGLVELHGGEVEAASAGPGMGAEFTVRLPVESEPAALAGEYAGGAAGGKELRILVIEDNRDAAESLRLVLEMIGHEVRVAFTGPEGVEEATAWRPDVVLSDIGLPGIDGYEVARRIRQAPGLEETLLVALTGYGGEEERRRGREAGFDHYLVKPADLADLQGVLASRHS